MSYRKKEMKNERKNKTDFQFSIMVNDRKLQYDLRTKLLLCRLLISFLLTRLKMTIVFKIKIKNKMWA